MRSNNTFIYAIIRLSILYIFILSFNIFKIYCFLVFPLEYIPINNYTFYNNNNQIKSPEKIMQILFYKNLITRIEIGTPSKIIPILIKNNDFKFYFVSANITDIRRT
jgi:ABC-type uncharacterized transport system permease subunit